MSRGQRRVSSASFTYPAVHTPAFMSQVSHAAAAALLRDFPNLQSSWFSAEPRRAASGSIREVSHMIWLQRRSIWIRFCFNLRLKLKCDAAVMSLDSHWLTDKKINKYIYIHIDDSQRWYCWKQVVAANLASLCLCSHQLHSLFTMIYIHQIHTYISQTFSLVGFNCFA